MVEKLRPDELASFKEAFDTFDRNSDGTISTKVRTDWNPIFEREGNYSNIGILSIFWISLSFIHTKS